MRRGACVWTAANKAPGDGVAPIGGDVVGDDRHDFGMILSVPLPSPGESWPTLQLPFRQRGNPL